MSLHLAFQNFSHWLHLNPEWGGLAAFLVALAESLAFIGTVIPGSVTMTAIGILVGSGVISIPMTLSLAIAGAFTGDTISYLIGYYFKNQLNNVWPFKKYPHWLNNGKKFFSKHGGKSVFLGRFIGPIRAMIPVLAGMLHMRPVKFFSFDIIAAALWAPVYLLPGFLLGFTTLALPADIAAKLLIGILLLLVVAWILFWTLRRFSTFILNRLDRQLNKIWGKMVSSKRFQLTCSLLYNANRPNDHGQFVLAFICVLASAIFLLLLFSVVTLGSAHIPGNHALHYFARSFRVDYLDHLMVFITSFGDKSVLLPLGGVIFLWLGMTKRWHAAWHWLTACLLSAGIAYVVKSLYYSPRPPGILFIKPSSSFPSGHATLATAYYGFLSWLICLDRPQWKKVVYPITTLIIALVIISRVYLGEHWPTDALGAIALSVAVISAVGISYQRTLSKAPNAISLIIIAILTLTIANAFYLTRNYRQLLTNATPVWKQAHLPMEKWWSGTGYPADPSAFFRLTRFGHPAELLNLQWAGQLSHIRRKLTHDGWLNLKAKHQQETLKKFKQAHMLEHLHSLFLPRLLNEQKPVLTMIKLDTIPNPDRPIVLTLWPGNTLLMPQQIPLWVGSISYYPQKNHLLIHGHYDTVPKNEALNALNSAVSKQSWETKPVPKDKIPVNLLPDPKSPHYIIFIRPQYSEHYWVK